MQTDGECAVPNGQVTTPRIGIVGGGLGGLVLARVLNRGGLPATVLERDAGPGARSQGGSLDLHPDTGQRALVAAGLIEQFHRYARPQGDEIRILDPAGHEHAHHRGASMPAALVPDQDGILAGRPEIDRTQLRALLLDSLPEHTVQWGRHVVDIEAVVGGGHRVRCSDNTVSEFDVLIGADGARSRVRTLLTAAEPEPVGVTMAMLWLHDLTRDPDLREIDALIGQGSLWCLGDNLNVGAQRTGNGDARVSVMARDTSIESDAGPRIPVGAGRRDLLELITDWNPQIIDLVARAGDQVTVYQVETLPAGLTWASRPDVTVVGDAAHLLPPVGEGANQAMLDGTELAHALLAHPDAPANAIALAETAMHDRIRPVAERSIQIQANLVSSHALSAMTRMFVG
jgi:2-polyprenyl-6-methoxyphenol hydroxylase-like FAD-dependent oxidoreductase